MTASVTPATLPAGGWSDVVAAVSNVDAKAARYACAIAVTVAPWARGDGIGAEMLAALRDEEVARGYRALVAPVRPVPGWLGVHERLGGEIVGTCERSQQFEGTRDEWETWTAQALPETGTVLVEGALAPRELVDGRGTLTESAVWILHRASEVFAVPPGPERADTELNHTEHGERDWRERGCSG